MLVAATARNAFSSTAVPDMKMTERCYVSEIASTTNVGGICRRK